MDIGRAFSFVFDDDEWLKKILIGGLISLVPLIGNFIVYGYMAEITRRAYEATGVDELPEWDDIGGYLTRGFIFWLGLALWALPFILLIVCGVMLLILLGAASGSEEYIGVAIVLFYAVVFPAIMLFSLASALVIPILLGRYTVQGRFGAMFEFDAIIADARRIGAMPLFLLAVTYLAASSAGQLGIVLCIVGVFFTVFYGQLVIAHAAGQAYRLTATVPPETAQTQGTVGF